MSITGCQHRVGPDEQWVAREMREHAEWRARMDEFMAERLKLGDGVVLSDSEQKYAQLYGYTPMEMWCFANTSYSREDIFAACSQNPWIERAVLMELAMHTGPHVGKFCHGPGAKQTHVPNIWL